MKKNTDVIIEQNVSIVMHENGKQSFMVAGSDFLLPKEYGFDKIEANEKAVFKIVFSRGSFKYANATKKYEMKPKDLSFSFSISLQGTIYSTEDHSFNIAFKQM